MYVLVASTLHQVDHFVSPITVREIIVGEKSPQIVGEITVGDRYTVGVTTQNGLMAKLYLPSKSKIKKKKKLVTSPPNCWGDNCW